MRIMRLWSTKVKTRSAMEKGGRGFGAGAAGCVAVRAVVWTLAGAGPERTECA